MQLPDYSGGSIINLMSSIATAIGKKHDYPELRILPAEEIEKFKNIVLIAVDGMGYSFLEKNFKETVFEKYLNGKMTSTFPSTTASAAVAFVTGLPPQQHGIPGWFVFLKEIGMISKILPFEPRVGKTQLSEWGITAKDIFDFSPFCSRINADCRIIYPKEFKKSEFNKYANGKAGLQYYNSLGEMFQQLEKTIKRKSSKKKFIYAYWGKLDELCHKIGTKDKKTIRHFKKIATETKKFLESVGKTNSVIIITADHGLIDGKTIMLEKYPELKETLLMPLSGDARTGYAFVKPGKNIEFERIVRQKMAKYCYAVKSKKLLEKKYFGLFEPNKKLEERIGDYTIMMKKNHALRDILPGEKEKNHIGNHGGLSKEEMLVPLIVIKNP